MKKNIEKKEKFDEPAKWGWSEDIIRKFWRQEKFELNGKIVEFYGLAHVPETAEIYHRELKEAINRASAVVLEAAPAAWGLFSDAAVKALAEAAGESKERTVDFLNSAPGVSFFRKMETVCAAAKKRIITVDPVDINEVIYKKLASQDERVFFLKVLAALGGIYGSIFSYVSSKRIRAEEDMGIYYGGAKNKITRRKFLGGALGFLGVLGFAPFIAEGLKKNGTLSGEPVSLEGFLYNLTDYRDVVIAKGIESVSKEKKLSGNGPIVAIYGGAHREPVKRYLSSGRMKEIKYSAYKPYCFVAEPMMRVYEFKDAAGWKIIEEKKI